MKGIGYKKLLFINYSLLIILASCSVSRQITKEARDILLSDSAISTGHIGISIYEPETGKYLYNYNGSHYFIPASNTKLFTLYAGMKFLGDSILSATWDMEDGHILLKPAGDPSFLHPDFPNQPLYDLLKRMNLPVVITNPGFMANPLGYGWTWDDYNESYMAERSAMPVYGNISSWSLPKGYIPSAADFFQRIQVTPPLFLDSLGRQYPALTEKEFTDTSKRGYFFWGLKRKKESNHFYFENASRLFHSAIIPFETSGEGILENLLRDTLKIATSTDNGKWINHRKPVYSLPADSLFTPMMHNSDNFFAEQTLLMTSNQRLGYMSDERIIDTILRKELKDIPQRPKWVDGSGLSRYNLFTPFDLIYILDKMEKEFGMKRMKTILATGNTGTLKNYYVKDSGYIYAKTGTLSNNCALGGYLFTKKGRQLIFSVMVNNYITGATPVRRAVEKFLEGIRNNF